MREKKEKNNQKTQHRVHISTGAGTKASPITALHWAFPRWHVLKQRLRLHHAGTQLPTPSISAWPCSRHPAAMQSSSCWHGPTTSSCTPPGHLKFLPHPSLALPQPCKPLSLHSHVQGYTQSTALVSPQSPPSCSLGAQGTTAVLAPPSSTTPLPAEVPPGRDKNALLMAPGSLAGPRGAPRVGNPLAL